MKTSDPFWGLFLSAILCPAILFAQQLNTEDFAFSNQNYLLAGSTFRSDVVMGIADVNADGLDDIIRLRQGVSLDIQIQHNHQSFTSYSFGEVSDRKQFSLAIADVDGNGFNDLLLGGAGDGLHLLRASANGLAFESEVLPNSILYTQGSNFVDINNDGFLDVFVCNDTATSRTWLHDGLGNFLPVTNLLPMNIYSPDSLNGGNYSSIWTDMDNDGDLDLYISKCYARATSVDDPRRINQLFVNDGNGQFSEQGLSAGLARNEQSWTTDFQDIDNDGDMDCFIVNHHAQGLLMENLGNGLFTDITAGSHIVTLLDGHLQGFFRDFDNDGFVDLLLSGQQGYEFFSNNGDKTFKRLDNPFGDYHLSTFACGDVNHDGRLDIYSASSSGTDMDVLWMNEEDENHFFAVSLDAPLTNRNAIGARVEIHGAWGVQIREVRSGEGYGISNSFTQYFGLGKAGYIDKLVIRWPGPNALVETYTDLRPDQFVKVIKGDCLYSDAHIRPSGELVLCSGQQVKLNAPAAVGYLWSDGATTPSIVVGASGSYQVTVTNQFGCQTESYPIEVVVDPQEKPVITVAGQQYDTLAICQGELIQLTASDALGYEWSNGSTNQSIIVHNAGTYQVTTVGLCESFSSAPLTVLVTNRPPVPEVVTDTIAGPGQVSLMASGPAPHWYDIEGTLLFVGTIYKPFITTTTHFFVENVITANGISCASRRILVEAVVNTSTGLDETAGGLKVVLFPNPAQDQVWISWQQETPRALELQIFNIQGVEVYQNGSSVMDRESWMILSVSDWPRGIYWLRFGKLIKKLVIH